MDLCDYNKFTIFKRAKKQNIEHNDRLRKDQFFENDYFITTFLRHDLDAPIFHLLKKLLKLFKTVLHQQYTQFEYSVHMNIARQRQWQAKRQCHSVILCCTVAHEMAIENIYRNLCRLFFSLTFDILDSLFRTFSSEKNCMESNGPELAKKINYADYVNRTSIYNLFSNPYTTRIAISVPMRFYRRALQ